MCHSIAQTDKIMNILKKINALVSAAMVMAAMTSCADRQDKEIVNPLVTEDGEIMRVADPCVCTYDGKYYLSASSDDGLVSYSSEDLQTWKEVGLIEILPADDPLKTMIWASEVHEHGGKYYLTYSGWNPETKTLDTNLGVGDCPWGPFTLTASPLIHIEGKNAIDANIFVDDDGEAYVYFSENGSSEEYPKGYGFLRQARLKPDFSGIEGEIMPVNDCYAEWELKSVPRGVLCNEAPTVFKHDGTYYMTFSANETHMGDYAVGCQTATSPLGPWKKYESNPLICSSPADGPRSIGGLPIIDSPGHNGIIFDKEGNPEYIIYHRHAPEVSEYPSNERMTCLGRAWIDDAGTFRVECFPDR